VKPVNSGASTDILRRALKLNAMIVLKSGAACMKAAVLWGLSVDNSTLQGYKWSSLRAFVAVLCRCSRLFRPEFRSREKGSALGRVLKPSPRLTDTDALARQALGNVCRTLAYCRPLVLLGGLGALAFLLSAVLPDDDGFQQEFLRGRVSFRALSHSKKAVENVTPIHISTTFSPVAKPHLRRPHGIAQAPCIAAVSVSGDFQTPACASRAPPPAV